jgi:prevent-host-death family protein
MASRTWQLQEAKSRFSELVDTVISKGAQTVTKHGKPAVVIISAEEYRKSIAPQKTIASVLRACPDDLSPLLGKRTRRIARKLNFD